MSWTDTLRESTLWDDFAAITSQIEADYKWKLPNSISVKNCDREDILSNFAWYFMRHFQAARDVIKNESASKQDLMTVANKLNQLAWADNYFLETYNDSERRKLEMFISERLMNPESVERDMLQAMVIMLETQIWAERIKINSAQSIMDTPAIINDALD